MRRTKRPHRSNDRQDKTITSPDNLRLCHLFSEMKWTQKKSRQNKFIRSSCCCRPVINSQLSQLINSFVVRKMCTFIDLDWKTIRFFFDVSIGHSPTRATFLSSDKICMCVQIWKEIVLELRATRIAIMTNLRNNFNLFCQFLDRLCVLWFCSFRIPVKLWGERNI